jgi:DNA repair protein RadD
MLRDYQIRTIKQLFQVIREGSRSVLVVVPCGGGKSTIFSKVCELCEQNEKKVLFVVHSRKLVSQFKERLWSQFGIRSGTIMSGVKENRRHNIQVASIMSLNNRQKPDADVVIIDEAHRAKSESYVKLAEMYGDKVLIGLTATPERRDGSGLGDIFSSIINPVKMRELIEKGFLVKTKMYAPFVELDFTDVSVKRGDYDEQQMLEKFESQIAYSEVVRMYKENANGKRAISFNISRAHAANMVDAFNAAGVPSAYIDGDTPDDERERIIAAFKKRDILHIANIAVFIEGVDIPEAECAILNRKTKSKMYYVQMIGRVQRPDNANGKIEAIVLDMGQNYYEHGFVEDYDMQEFVLAKGKKKLNKQEEPKTKVCDNCGVVNALNTSKCKDCGTPFKIKEVVVEPVRGVKMRVLERDGVILEQIATKPYKWTKSAPVGMLLLIEVVKGYKKGWAVFNYKDRDEKYKNLSYSQVMYILEQEEHVMELAKLRREIHTGVGIKEGKKKVSWSGF